MVMSGSDMPSRGSPRDVLDNAGGLLKGSSLVVSQPQRDSMPMAEITTIANLRRPTDALDR